MAMTYAKVQQYLDAIAAKANLDASNAGHGVFWHVSYYDFVNGSIPHKQCDGRAVPIIDPNDKTQSAFFLILKAGWCGMPQMPRTGPFITGSTYSVTLSDGSVIAGDKLLQDIHDWLAAGALENG
jgi:hypothetical protein